MSNLPKDKVLHFTAGFLLCIIFTLIDDPITGVGAAICGGIMKECYDQHDYGKFDFADALATWVGGIAGYIVALLIHTL